MVNFKKDKSQSDQPFVTNCAWAWQKIALKYNADFLVWEDAVADMDVLPTTFQRYYLLDVLEATKQEYDQICCVDYDTFPMWKCPNFFELTNGQFTAVPDGGEPHQLNRSIRMVRENWYSEVTDVNWANYFNAGFQVYNKAHKAALHEVIDFRKTQGHRWYTINKSSDFNDDQTILNFTIRKHKFPITLLPRSFNVMDHHMRCMLFNGPDSNNRFISAIQTMEDCAHIFHFTGGNDQRNQLTSFILNETSKKYE